MAFPKGNAENTPRAEIVLRETSSLMSSAKLLKADPNSMTEAEVVTAWSVLDVMEKEIMKTRKEQLRQAIFTMAEKKGVKGETGSFVYSLPFSTAKVTKQFTKGRVKEKSYGEVRDSSLRPEAKSKILKMTVVFDEEQRQELLRYIDLIPRTEKMRDSVLSAIHLGTPSVDMEAAEACYKLGLITDKQMGELATVEPPSYTLKVVKPREVTDLLERSLNGKGSSS